MTAQESDQSRVKLKTILFNKSFFKSNDYKLHTQASTHLKIYQSTFYILLKIYGRFEFPSDTVLFVICNIIS